MLTEFQIAWMQNAPGQAVNRDFVGGFQCVDVPKNYVQHIFANTVWQQVWPGAGNAKDMLFTFSPDFLIQILNDPSDPSQIPLPGDIVVWAGTGDGGLNPFGHIAVCVDADVNGVDVIQQDGFLQVPMFRARLGYTNAGTGPVTGWLRPFFDPAPPPPVAELAPNERIAGTSEVNQRSDPRTNAPVVRVIPAGSREAWNGYVRGDTVDVGGGNASPLWFADSVGFASVLFFDPANVDGLPDLTPARSVPEHTSEPILAGIDVSQHQAGADLSSIPADFALIKATEGVDFRDPSLLDHLAGARAGGRRIGFYHLARADTPENTVHAEAQTFLEATRTLLRPGDLVALDWEPSNPADPSWALDWLTRVRVGTGAIPLIYMNQDTVNTRDWSRVEQEFPLWMAAYPLGKQPIEGHSPDTAGPKIPTSWAAGFRAWQYTASGRMPGFDGNLLLDVFYGVASDWDSLGAAPV
ncbi:GH25 family lysozyme [Sinomonas gamaensis]|uniref:GH25 family lysozyme n=1 Tax=Sinomonas gamaensis TaxID=2565624 RepID=UPI0014863DAC|nr:GH25 family lysozyme [Sinomonas gamaensis]